MGKQWAVIEKYGRQRVRAFFYIGDLDGWWWQLGSRYKGAWE